MPSVEHGFIDLDLVCQEIDLLCLEKDHTAQATEQGIELVEEDISCLITAQNHSSNCIASLNNYII